jgi:hypothetical protein
MIYAQALTAILYFVDVGLSQKEVKITDDLCGNSKV